MNTMFKNYWRNVNEPPTEKMYCIVSLTNSGVRNACYDPETECFMTVSRTESKPIGGVKYWIPMPIVTPDVKSGVVNRDVPVEVVYANLYDAYKERGLLLKELRSYIRNLHTFIEAENKSERVHAILNDLAKSKLTWDKLKSRSIEMYDYVKDLKQC